MDYQQYCKYVSCVFPEELERMEEYTYSIRNSYDCSEEKYWIKDPQCPPSLEEMVVMVKGRDIKQDMKDFDSNDINRIEEIVEEIRNNW